MYMLALKGVGWKEWRRMEPGEGKKKGAHQPLDVTRIESFQCKQGATATKDKLLLF